MEAPDLDVPDFSVESSDRRRGDSDAESRLSAQVAELKALLLRAEAKADEERKRAEAIERRALKAEKAQARLRKKEEDDTKQLNDVVQVPLRPHSPSNSHQVGLTSFPSRPSNTI
jgi:nitrate reductase cytochrome c-type subunit